MNNKNPPKIKSMIYVIPKKASLINWSNVANWNLKLFFVNLLKYDFAKETCTIGKYIKIDKHMMDNKITPLRFGWNKTVERITFNPTDNIMRGE